MFLCGGAAAVAALAALINGEFLIAVIAIGLWSLIIVPLWFMQKRFR
jgi:hypothetical protein